MPDIISVPPANLLLDENNPRLSQPNKGQRETLRTMAKMLNRKVLTLATDIAQFGLDPSTLMIVVPHSDDGKYSVLEGNRRLVALKALENPESVTGAVDPKVQAGLRSLNTQYQKSPVESATCVRFKDTEEAKHWIKIRHTGENDGVGLLRWGSDEQLRFDARNTAMPIHAQALDFLEKSGHLTRERRSQIPTASLKRMLESPPIRAKLGVSLKDGSLVLHGSKAKVVKALLYVVDNLITGDTKTEDIYTKDDRLAYAAQIPKAIVVPPSGKETVAEAVAKAKPVTLKRTRPIKARTALIPGSCVLKISEPRIQEVEDELRRLNMEDYENATSVMFRVFLELSTDAYMAAKGLPSDENTKLRHKVELVMKDLLTSTKLSKSSAVPVRRAMQNDSMFAPSIHLMHQYVHNKHVFPTAKELRKGWDELQPFFVAMWS